MPSTHRPPELARAPFTYRQARAAGVTRSQLASPSYVCLLRGIYVSSDLAVDAATTARAALLSVRGEDAFVSHHSAARLWGGVVPDGPRPHVSVPSAQGRSVRQDIAVHASRRQPTTFRGLRVTTATDTFLDPAAHLELVDLVILGDSLVRKRRCTPDELVEAADGATGRGVRRVRRAAGMVRAGVDSPMETRSRMLRVLSGLPELETDIRFVDPRTGQLRRRLDSGDRPSRTGVEYDGRHHVEREQQWEADIERREEFENEQWRILTLVSKDIFVTPGRTVERQRALFHQRGIHVGRLSDEWRRHFPGRG